MKSDGVAFKCHMKTSLSDIKVDEPQLPGCIKEHKTDNCYEINS